MPILPRTFAGALSHLTSLSGRLTDSPLGARLTALAAAIVAFILADSFWDPLTNAAANHGAGEWLIQTVLIAPAWSIGAIAFFATLASGFAWRNAALERPLLTAMLVRQHGGAVAEMKLRVHNTGTGALANCYVQVESFNDPQNAYRLPRQLRSEAQARSEESGPFALGPGEAANILLCSRGIGDPETSAEPIAIAYEPGPHGQLDATRSHFITIGIYGGRLPIQQRYRLFVDRDHRLDMVGPI
jgi:hypothetical protein